MRLRDRFRGLSWKIYIAFLFAAGGPVAVAGLVGIHYSLEALRAETLQHLGQEVSSRAARMVHFFDQLTSELLYIGTSTLLRDLANVMRETGDAGTPEIVLRLERDYAAFARAYPYIYQVRFVSASGREIVRVDRRDGRIYTVPREELQDKSDRYYLHDALGIEAGQVYISPLDLNVEHGRAEVPEKPVIRFATPIVDRAGEKRGILIINLHASYVLEQIEQMAERGGVSYLFDRSGFYLSRSATAPDSTPSVRMQSAETLAGLMPRSLLTRIVSGEQGNEVLGDWIVAFSPIAPGQTLADRGPQPTEWAIALAVPRKRLFEAVFNLYLLYGVLTVSLAVTAAAGFLLSRRLLKPLILLAGETEEIARGHFGRRVEIRGRDEIADLGARFNAMAARLDETYRAIEGQKGRLELEVQARIAELAREHNNLATIIESTADGILSVNRQGVIGLANAAAARQLGVERDRLAGRLLAEACPGSGNLLEEIQRHDGAAGPRIVELVHNGLNLSLNIAPVAPTDQPEGFIVVVRDVSEERRFAESRRELDRQMFQMEKMTALGELVMGLAHEIGNPLAGMKSVVQMLIEEEAADLSHQGYLRRIEAEIDRLSGFLRTFHGYAAPQDTNPAPVSLDQALADVLLWTRKEAQARGVTIMHEPCRPTLPDLWADPNQLKQVLLNLVINAIQATPKGGRVDIGMCFGKPHQEDLDGPVPRMRFCISDTGHGIAPEVLPKIFDPFFTTRANGSGLGLAVVKKVAVQHGADIHVTSRPGEGTTFELIWPVAPLGDTVVRRRGEAAVMTCRRPVADA
jgi:PAS domain S-box-containing protein